jgi:uncharacterized protein (TIGR02265 family)
VGTTAGFVFEATFLRGLDCPPALHEALSGIGVELDALEARYPSVTWIAALDLARGYLARPDETAAMVERRVGRALFEGSLLTLPGRLLAAALPHMRPWGLLARTPMYVRMGRDDLVVEVDDADHRCLRLTVQDPASARPWVFRGMVEAALDRIGEPYELEHREVDEWSFDLCVRLGNDP